MLTLAIIAAGLAGRAAVDKVLALRGGAELVAFWAQVGSVIEVLTGVAVTGVAMGLSVLVAQGAAPQRLLRESLKLCLLVTAPLALLFALSGWLAPDAAQALGFPGAALVAAAAAGWIAVAPTTINSWWLGLQRRGSMLSLAVATGGLALLAALVFPEKHLLVGLCVAQALPALLLPFVLKRTNAPPDLQARATLRRYILPGLAIGILSPLSLVLARGVIGTQLSWHDAGVLQALWRLQDWVASIAAGVLWVYYMPRFAAAHGTPRFAVEVRGAMLAVVVPSAAALVLLALVQEPAIVVLYDESFSASGFASWLLFVGTLVRIAAWVPLFALYAMHRTRAIAVGEFLSLPLFVLLLWADGAALTLERAAAFWLLSYFAYAAFNLWASRTRLPATEEASHER